MSTSLGQQVIRTQAQKSLGLGIESHPTSYLNDTNRVRDYRSKDFNQLSQGQFQYKKYAVTRSCIFNLTNQ